MPAPVDRDLRLAALLFLGCTVLLMLGALLGLNIWPGQALFQALASGSAADVFVAFHGYGLVICMEFWGSRPSPRAQRTVLLAWPLLSVLLWYQLSPALTIGWADPSHFPVVMFLATSLAVPCLLALLLRITRSGGSGGRDPGFEYRLRWLVILTFLFMMTPHAALTLTATLHPLTLDFHALRWDHAAGIDITPALVSLIDAVPGLPEMVRMAYGLTPLSFLAVALLHLRGRPAHTPPALLLWVVLTVCALSAYHFFPIAGPKYLFGSDNFVAALRDAGSFSLVPAMIPPFPRNGMPSMHFGWMLAAAWLWWQAETRWFSRALITVMTVLTAAATLYTGEHYVIDLIVAVPFVFAAIALTTTGAALPARARWRSVGAGFATWLGWVFALRLQLDLFIRYPLLCQAALALTALVVVAQLRWQRPAAAALTQAVAAPPRPHPAAPTADSAARLTHRMGLMFFVSGAAALVYQVLFAKELALVFGSTATATFTVLATFLGGMAIGSLIGGAVAARVTRPIVAYALVELAIGGFCIATPALFSALQGAYVFFAADLPPASPLLLALRVALGAGVGVVPRVLWGGPLPLRALGLKPPGAGRGARGAWLYACNTAGAALGALFTSYAVIPLVGVHSTTLIAALLNFMVALGALELAKSIAPALARAAPPPRAAAAAPPCGTHALVSGRRRLTAAWFALGVGGVLSLGLEVVYVHLLSIVAGNSVYAFGLMLAIFLVGLALGGEVGRRLLERPGTDRAAWLVATQLTLAAAVAFGAWGWDMIPTYFASFAGYPAVTTFSAREAVRGLVCALVMVPPTVCIGLSYTLAMDLATSATARRGITMLGLSAALNTFGNIAGVLLFGFLLLPWLGGLVAAKLIAAGALLAAAVGMGAVAGRATVGRLGAALTAVIALVIVSPTRLDYESLSSGANVYFAAQNWGEVIAHAESIDGGLTTVVRRTENDVTVSTLLTNGKFQGNDARQGEVQAQIGFAALPLLHQERRDNALVIGYGTGATSRVFHDAGFAHLDIAELSRDVVNLADTHFAAINATVSQQPGVQTHITDGRNLLLLTRRQYDIISIEITSIWFAGAASLYNREFYQLVRSKLRPDGVLQQWVQLHHMAPTDLLTIVGTLRAEFSYVSLYVVGGQGILIATNDPAHAQSSASVVAKLDESPRLQFVREMAGRRFSDIANDLLLSPGQVDVLLDEIGLNRALWISTDNNLRLEYNTPKANANPPDRSFEINLKLLRSAQRNVIAKSDTGLSSPEIYRNP